MRKSLSSGILLGLLASAAAAGDIETLDISEGWAKIPEIERLHYYKEIDLAPAIKQFGLSGNGVRVTIMGEMTDAAHPQIHDAVVRQYNAFTRKGEIVPGEGNQPFRAERLQHGDGHGTHIAGIIAAKCDGIGMLGVACGSSLDVYSIGAYSNPERFISGDTPPEDEITGFLGSFALALHDVAQRGESRIVTGSFNLEAPALQFAEPVHLKVSDMNKMGDEDNPSGQNILKSPLFEAVVPEDRAMLERVIKANGGDASIAMFALTSQTDAFNEVANAVAEYQKTDGVYIVTESNYRFEDRSSVLNALPTLNDRVDPDLWLSVVMIAPEGLGQATTSEEMEAARNGPYIAPINGCGTMAKDYCIVTPSYNVISTMTKRVAEENMPLIIADGDPYQMFSGHSMGAPMVAATLALMEEYNRREGFGYSMKDLVRILKDNANRNFKGYDPVRHGRGMLDVAAAIRAMG